jgi:hypothetical protein
MAGITAASASKTHTTTTVDASAAGFIVGESVVLGATPAGSSYIWAISLPSGSNAIRATLTSDDGAASSFTPDVPGIYTVYANVDGTEYVLRIAAIRLAQSNSLEAIRLTPVADAQIPAPAVGGTVYWSSTQDGLALKDAAGDVFTVNVTAV